MIVLRNKLFSMLDKITGSLDKNGVEYEVSPKVPRDEVGILGDTKNTVIYVPEDYEEELYRIDDFIRHEARFLRTKTETVPGKKWLNAISVQGNLTLPQYTNLVKFIVDETDSCKIVNL